MKKRILSLALTLVLLLCGCGGSEKNAYTLSHADELLASGAFEGSEMGPVDMDVVSILYGIGTSAITEGVCYMAANTSASADELTLLILTDEESAIAAEAAFRTRVESQLIVCKSYCPAAVPRLENAFVARRGNTVLLAVGDPQVIQLLESIQN